MWVLIAVFFFALIAWSGVLWLLLTIDIFDYSMAVIVGMHVLPPLLVVGCWATIRFMKKRRRAAQQQQLEEAQLKAQEAERNRQKTAFDKALQERRAAVECRWAAVGGLVLQRTGVQLAENTEQTRAYDTSATQQSEWPNDSLLSMLEDLYLAVPIAGEFPIAFCAPSNEVSGEVAKNILALHGQAFKTKLSASLFDVFPLPVRGESIPDALLDLFTSRPDLPGVVVVAFDSSLRDAADIDGWPDIEEAQPLSEIEKWLGKPGRAVTVQLFTPGVLALTLAKIDSLPDNIALSAMTPHWERQQIPIGMASWLVQWPKAQRDALAAFQPIARLHLPCSVALTENLLSSRNRQQVKATFKEAAINAGLIDPPFVAEGEAAPSETPVEIKNCGWIVHNAGDIAHCGDRLALLCYAVEQHGIAVNPVEEASAVVPDFGNCGEAAQWLWLALAIQRAAMLHRHVVLAEFNVDVLRICFVAAVAHE